MTNGPPQRGDGPFDRVPTAQQVDRLVAVILDPDPGHARLKTNGLLHSLRGQRNAGKQALDRWLSWARCCRIPAFVARGRKITHYRPAIDAALDHDLSNALVESTNPKAGRELAAGDSHPTA